MVNAFDVGAKRVSTGSRRLTRMRSGWMSMAALLGCGTAVAVDGENSTGDGTGTSAASATSTSATNTATTLPGTTTTTTSADTMTSDDGSSEVGNFIQDPDGGMCFTHCGECDLWSQDCPDGSRCTPWANDGGDQWNATFCRALVPDPAQPGEPCMIEGSPHSGNDDCAISSMCWDIDPDAGIGTCVQFCGGSEANPSCPDGSSCFIANEGVLILCLPTCDPLAPACGEDLACAANREEFFCVPAERVVEAYAAPCDPYLGCGSGLDCRGPGSTPGCDANCCTALCDLAAPSCPDEAGGQACVPYFERGMAPMGLEPLGVCLIE